MVYYIARQKDDATNRWLLQNIDSGDTQVVTTDQIKECMKDKKVNVINLQLAKDGSLRRQGQFQFNKRSLAGIKAAPKGLKYKRGLNACLTSDMEYFEASMDKAMHDAINAMSKDTNGRVTGIVLSADKNLLQVKILLKDRKIFKDSYITILVRYEQCLYGKLMDTGYEGDIIGDIALGIRAIRTPDGSVFNIDSGIVYMSNCVSKYWMQSHECYNISDELTVRKGEDKNYFHIRPQENGMFKLDSHAEDSVFSNALLTSVGILATKYCKARGITEKQLCSAARLAKIAKEDFTEPMYGNGVCSDKEAFRSVEATYNTLVNLEVNKSKKVKKPNKVLGTLSDAFDTVVDAKETADEWCDEHADALITAAGCIPIATLMGVVFVTCGVLTGILTTLTTVAGCIAIETYGKDIGDIAKHLIGTDSADYA